MDAKIQAAINIIGYTFADPLILWEALNVAGSNVMSAGNRSFPNGNKRLALLGDSIIKTAMLDGWYLTGQTRREGQNMVSTIASNNNLATVGFRNGIDVAMNKNPSQYGQVSPDVMATTVEAIIGAIYLDAGNFFAVKQALTKLGV